MQFLKHYSFLLFGLMCLSACAQLPDKASPFTAVKWEGDQPIVQFEGAWYEWLQLDDLAVSEIIVFAKDEYEDRWQKRVSEDLVEVLAGMDHTPKVEVRLTLRKDGKTVTATGRMTEENRKGVWQYNQDPTAHTGSETKDDDDENDIQEAVEDKLLEITKPNNDALTYGFKSAKIVYEFSEAWTGTMTMYIDNYGETVVLVKEMSELSMADNKTTIWQNEEATIIDHNNKTYFTMRLRPKDTEPPTIGTWNSEEKILNNGFDKLEDLTIAGKPCKGYKNQYVDASYWLWKGIDLKQINHAAGKKIGFTKIAISVEEGVNIPTEVFEIPEGYVSR